MEVLRYARNQNNTKISVGGEKMMRYRYYSTQRPLMPGGYPEPTGNRVMDIRNYDCRLLVNGIGGEAWGYVEYEKPLAEKEVQLYELVPAIASRETFRSVERYMTEHGVLLADKIKVRRFLADAQAVCAVITKTRILYKEQDGNIKAISRSLLGVHDNFE
jgi:hypothetical protein